MTFSMPHHMAFPPVGNKPMQFEFQQKKLLKSQVLLEAGLLEKIEWKTILPVRREAVHFIITDKTVNVLYGKKLQEDMLRAGFSIQKLVLNPGEKAKSFKVYEQLSQKILQSISKDSFIIGLGGGVVNNMAGFLASTLYRGVGLIQIPTTLMAQADAAIDFKQAINSRVGKNHIGSYYPASTILVDPFLLQTLPIRHIRNGLAESIKHGITQDLESLNYFLEHGDDVLNKDFLYVVVTRNIQLKVQLLHEPHGSEHAEMIPQYGHAVGHALEQLSHYGLLHGEALAIGMCVMAEVALELGLCDDKTVKAHYHILESFSLPTSIPEKISLRRLLGTLRHDKHHIGIVQSILISHIGQVGKHGEDWVFPIELRTLKRAFIKNQKRVKSNIRPTA